MKIENFIVLRYLKNLRKSKEISDSALVVIIAIVISVIFFISSLSIMNGYILGRMKIQFEVVSFHIIYTNIATIDNVNYILENIKNNKDVRFSSIFRESKVLLSANQINTGLFYFRTVEENVFEEDTGLSEVVRLIEGKKSIHNNEILISKKTKEKLRVNVGDYIYLTSIKEDADAKFLIKRVKVSGIFTTGFTELDEQLAYVNNKTGDDLFKDTLKYNVYVKLKDYRKTEDFLSKNSFSYISYPYTWIDYNYNEFTALKFEKGVIGLIVMLVVFVAALNILTVINITILEKRNDIGILKAIGYSPENIVVIFLLNGIYLGFGGLIFGVIFGLVIMRHLNEIMIVFSEIINFILLFSTRIISIFVRDIPVPSRIEIFSKDFYLDKIYTDIYFSEIVIICFLTLIFSILSSIIPSVKAGSIKPNEVIKNG